jgi:hypothetical protein
MSHNDINTLAGLVGKNWGYWLMALVAVLFGPMVYSATRWAYIRADLRRWR